MKLFFVVKSVLAGSCDVIGGGNSLLPQDVKFVLMVGGSTYIPFVRKRIEERLGIAVNMGIDPTNAIVIGAAYYAATKEIDLGKKSVEKAAQPTDLIIKFSYNRTSQEQEEMFAAKIEGDIDGRFYRITREDGGYNSGLKKLTLRIDEDLPLQQDAYNLFTFRIYDEQNNPVPVDIDLIQIAQGKYSVAGQPLPEDLSLLLDGIEDYETRSGQLFARNTILPARRKMTVEASKTIVHGTDDAIKIIVVEGPNENHWAANKTVGCLLISAKNLKRDIFRGADIDLEFEVTESRDLRVKAFIASIDQEYGDVFTPQYRNVPVKALQDEIELLENRVEQEKAEAVSNENFEVAQELEDLSDPLKEIHGKALLLDIEDVTDDRYKLEDKKRRIAQMLHKLTSGKRLDRLRADYQAAKEEVAEVVNESGNDHERKQLHEILTQERAFLSTTNPRKLEERITQLYSIESQILLRTPDFLKRWFEELVERRELFNDQIQAKNLIEAGKLYIRTEDYDKLTDVNRRLYNLLPQQEQDSKEMQYFTGIR